MFCNARGVVDVNICNAGRDSGGGGRGPRRFREDEGVVDLRIAVEDKDVVEELLGTADSKGGCLRRTMFPFRN